MNESEIRRIFERSNLSQADFAERIGKSTRTFQHYLKGETTPNSRVISKLKEIETELKVDRTKNTSYYQHPDFNDINVINYVYKNKDRLWESRSFRLIVESFFLDLEIAKELEKERKIRKVQ